jgi:hypothetical protein
MAIFRWHWERWYWGPIVLLAFFGGLAIGNGHTTYHAITEAKQSTWGDCKWTLRRELSHQRSKLVSQ